jgi:hypothetical protein
MNLNLNKRSSGMSLSKDFVGIGRRHRNSIFFGISLRGILPDEVPQDNV